VLGYALLDALAAPDAGYVVLVIDPLHRFDATRLRWPQHIHVLRPPPDADLAVLSCQAREYILLGQHASRHCEFWGTLLFGDPVTPTTGVRANVTIGRHGWLRVERERVAGFSERLTIEEALARREERLGIVDQSGWTVECAWGSFQLAG